MDPTITPTTSLSEKKPIILTIISITTLLVSGSFAFTALLFLLIDLILTRVFESPALGTTETVFKLIPTFVYIPTLQAITSVSILYTALQAKSGSRASFWFILLALLIVGPICSIITWILFSQFHQPMSSLGVPAPTFFPLAAVSLAFGPAFLLSVSAVILLVIFRKNFQYQHSPLSLNSRVFFTIASLLILGPTVGYSSYEVIKTNDTDLGYSKTSAAASYHVYRSTNPPNGIYQATYFSSANLAGKNNAVKVTYSTGYIGTPRYTPGYWHFPY